MEIGDSVDIAALLEEVEGAMMESSSSQSGAMTVTSGVANDLCGGIDLHREGKGTTMSTGWTHPPLNSKLSCHLEAKKPPLWAGSTRRDQERIEGVTGVALDPERVGSAERTASTTMFVAALPTVGVEATIATGTCIPSEDFDDVDDLLRVVSADKAESECTTRAVDTFRNEAPEPAKKQLTPPAVDVSNVPVNEPAKNADNLRAVAMKRKRCGTVCVAGAKVRKGFCASSLSQCACDRLRCTACNFEVLRFDGRAWDADTDYMFFRNNSPDPIKLGVKLQPSSEMCAYACQCSWQNVESLRVLSPTESLRWACGGH